MKIEIVQNVIFGMLNRLSFFVANILLFYLLTPEEYGMYGLAWTTINTIAAVGMQPAGHGYRRELIESKWPLKNLGIFYYISSLFIVICSFLGYLLLTKNTMVGVSGWLLLLMSFCICVIAIGPYSLVIKGKLLQANQGVFLANSTYLILLFANPFNDSVSITFVITMLSLSLLVGALWILYLDYGGEQSGFCDWIRSSDRSSEFKFMLPIVFQSLLGMPVLLLAQIVIGKEYGYDALGKVFLIIQISNLVGIAAKRILHIMSPKVLADKKKEILNQYFKYYCLACILISFLALGAFGIGRHFSESMATINMGVLSVFLAFSLINIMGWFYADILNSSGGQNMVLRANIFWAIGATLLLFILQKSFDSPILLYAFCFLGTKVFVLFYLKTKLKINFQIETKGVTGA